MKLGANHPMGPSSWATFIGLDVCLAIMDVLYQETPRPGHRASSPPQDGPRRLPRPQDRKGFYDYSKK